MVNPPIGFSGMHWQNFLNFVTSFSGILLQKTKWYKQHIGSSLLQKYPVTSSMNKVPSGNFLTGLKFACLAIIKRAGNHCACSSDLLGELVTHCPY
jgi:hypothetical protein